MGLGRGRTGIQEGHRAQPKFRDSTSLVRRLSGEHGPVGGRTARDKKGSRIGSSFSIAEGYMRMGEKDKAFDWLEKAYEEHDSGLVSIGVEPMFDPVRRDPRFRDILRRMKLPS